MSFTNPAIAIVGGTGDLGTGLARRFSRAGYRVTIGSRDTDRAQSRATTLTRDLGVEVHGAVNAEATAGADIVIMTVPFKSHERTLESIQAALEGKILVDATVPLVPPKVMRVQLPPNGSAAKRAQEFLGKDVRVVSAFQNVSAIHIQDEEHALECDVLVCGNDNEARQTVIDLANAIGLTAWHAGPIDNSAAAEALTSILIFLNRRYRLQGAGIRITGEPGTSGP